MLSELRSYFAYSRLPSSPELLRNEAQLLLKLHLRSNVLNLMLTSCYFSFLGQMLLDHPRLGVKLRSRVVRLSEWEVLGVGFASFSYLSGSCVFKLLFLNLLYVSTKRHFAFELRKDPRTWLGHAAANSAL